MTRAQRQAYRNSLTPEKYEALQSIWWLHAHPHQDEPKGQWRQWVLLAGRGAGKTRAGAEWVNQLASRGLVQRIGLIGETMHDAANVMIEGQSGLMSPLLPNMRPDFVKSRRKLFWDSGTTGDVISADDPEQLRGPQFDLIWADEFAKWRRADMALDMAQMTLRLGTHPRMLVTTTPRPVSALKRLLALPSTVTTRATTFDNAQYLAPSYLEQMQAMYGGTRLGRQELMADMLSDPDDAMWQRGWIDAGRVTAAPALKRVVVAVDPPVTSGARADRCGIIVAGHCAKGEIYVLHDASVQGLTPAGWAEAVRRAAETHEAGAIIAETNQGGELISGLLRQVCGERRVVRVHARSDKQTRAEMVSVAYEKGQAHHVGTFAALEDEMCLFGSRDYSASPDRVDALVWAVRDLMGQGREPKVREL